MRQLTFLLLTMSAIGLAGCASLPAANEPISTAAQLSEPAWIRNGEPITFENEDWLPTDDVENILDSEVYQAGTYRNVPFYLEKTDVRPYDQVMTRFGKNRYRIFER